MSPDGRPVGVWRKSSRSASGNNECVEVFLGEGGVYIRDSKSPHDPGLEFTNAAWQRFIDAVKCDHVF